MDYRAAQNKISLCIDFLHLNQLIFMPYPLVAYRTMMQINNRALTTNNIENLGSTGNYIFEVPNANCLIKIAGLPNRVCTLIKSTGTDPYDKSGLQKLDLNKIEHVSTYQTISRIAYFLSMMNVLNDKGLVKHQIIVPKTYLLPIPGRANTVSDDNFFVVQEKIPNLRPLDLSDLAKMKDKDLQQTLKELYAIAQTGVFWNVKADSLMSNNKGNIIPLDFEQPNNSDPRQFFNKDEGTRARLAGDGLRRLQNMINATNNETLKTNWAIVKSWTEK